MGDDASEAETSTAESEPARAYSREFLLAARHGVNEQFEHGGTSLIKQISIPSHLVNDWSESEQHSDESETVPLEDQCYNFYVYDFDPELFPTWEEFLPTAEFSAVAWNWSEPKTTKCTQL